MAACARHALISSSPQAGPGRRPLIIQYRNKPRTGADFNEWPQIGVFGNRHPRSALCGPRGRGAPKSAHTHAGRPEIRVSRRHCAAAPEIGADLARTENDPRSTRLLEGRPEIDAVRLVCAKRLRSGHRRRGAPQINDRSTMSVETDPRSAHGPRSTQLAQVCPHINADTLRAGE